MLRYPQILQQVAAKLLQAPEEARHVARELGPPRAVTRLRAAVAPGLAGGRLALRRLPGGRPRALPAQHRLARRLRRPLVQVLGARDVAHGLGGRQRHRVRQSQPHHLAVLHGDRHLPLGAHRRTQAACMRRQHRPAEAVLHVHRQEARQARQAVHQQLVGCREHREGRAPSGDKAAGGAAAQLVRQVDLCCGGALAAGQRGAAHLDALVAGQQEERRPQLLHIDLKHRHARLAVEG
mmetsp:Transcript_31125/g.78615  ORF Transcript_31125/g.78615 Transcript_31125/m.78615 type:complete len:237 (+) Transcript_31125:656-1366(+)